VHLYAAFLGGPLAADRMGEDHEVVFVVANDPAEATEQARAKWRGVGRGHVDAVQCLDVIDGYEVEIVANGSGTDRTVLDN